MIPYHRLVAQSEAPAILHGRCVCSCHALMLLRERPKSVEGNRCPECAEELFQPWTQVVDSFA